MEEYASSVWLDWNHQGAVISPILASIYLDDFDEIFSTADLKLVRYADDFVLMARSQKRIMQAKAEVAQVLGSMGLQLHPDKTQWVKLEEDNVRFYWVPKDALPRTLTIGSAAPEPPQTLYIV